ncbi:MAG: helix-turn-helix domain-containing protein [Candidatus Omnitrophota bacterium]
MGNKEKAYISIPELAKILGLSRIAVFNKVKSGEIKAVKIGRNYAILRTSVDEIMGKALNESQRREIDNVVKRTVKEYGQTLKLLGRD